MQFNHLVLIGTPVLFYGILTLGTVQDLVADFDGMDFENCWKYMCLLVFMRQTSSVCWIWGSVLTVFLAVLQAGHSIEESDMHVLEPCILKNYLTLNYFCEGKTKNTKQTSKNLKFHLFCCI